MFQKEMTTGDSRMLIPGGQWAVNREFGEERLSLNCFSQVVRKAIADSCSLVNES